MCGITGFWTPDKNNKDSETIAKKMLSTLYHRGPDGAAYHFDPTQNLVMGHTRLSIVDLSTTGNQPLYDNNRNLIFTANGEFYNYKTQRARLVAQGRSFHSKSDSEIALKLYQQYGLSFVDHLRGEFAFALFDKKAEKLILVRDRFGIRPLFYQISDQGIIYGSEIKAIFAHPHVKAAISPKDALHQMMQVMVPGRTLFEGIRALRPGHMLIVQKTSSGIEYREKCYWDIDYPLNGRHDHTKTVSQHVEEIREKLIEAIHIRLEADVPVGCYLSGGIDSASIFGVADALQQSPVKAFTISFENKDFDEAMIAIEMAASVNADHEILTVKSEDLYGDNFKKALWHSERTFYNTLGISKMLMSQRVREYRYKVVLTGEGADEIFGGYVFFKKDMFLHGKPAPELQKKLMETNRLFQGSLLSEQTVSHPAFEALCGFTPSWI
jgi:asparagine synthase (glutamine-hydrolysing)